MGTLQEQAGAPAPAPAGSPAAVAWGPRDWALLASVTVLAAFLRFWRLTFPNRMVFDEMYYAKDACLLLHDSVSGLKVCASPSLRELSWVQPELGKWLIAAGEEVFGYNALGWRVPSALFGTALVVVVFFLGRRLFGRWGGVVAGFLAATDFLLIRESRLAMLDIFLAFFVALAFLFVVLERERLAAARSRAEAPGGWWALRWRLAAGVAFGAACAVKWSGFFALAAGAVFLVAWNVAQARRGARGERGGPGCGSGGAGEVVRTGLALAVPLVVVYLGAYAQWFAHHGFSLARFVAFQRQMLSYQLHLSGPGPYQTRAWTWPFQIQPIAIWHSPGNEAAHALVMMPNPVVWWAAIPAGLWCLSRCARKGGLRYGVVMAGWLSQYLPWLAVTRPLYFYYLTPAAPFIDLAVAAALLDLARSTAFARRLVVVFLAGTLAVLAYYLPGLVGALHPRLFM